MNGDNRGLRADAAAKRFLHRRSILASIIGGLVDECRGMPRAEIEACLGNGEYIEGLENDSPCIPGREDTVFEAVLPLPNGERIALMINIEPQDDCSSLDDIYERAKDYISDLRTRQSRRYEGRRGAPDKFKVRLRAMNVWILMSPRADLRNSIHVLGDEDHVPYARGAPKLEMRDVDTKVLVCLGDPEEEGDYEPLPELLEALDWSMARGIDDRRRVEKLSELGYEVDRGMENELIGMNSIEADRERRARREGVAEGRIEGKIEDASRMLADGMPEDKVRHYTGLTEEQMEEARNLR